MEYGCTAHPSASPADRKVHRGTIQNRQRARNADTHRTDVRVRFGAERGAAAAENLGRGEQLRVDLKTNNSFKRHRW
jgi:hypothetical protein